MCNCHCPECLDDCHCEDCDLAGLSRCHNCGELKSDPDEFYDGLICTMCVEEREGW